MKTLCAILSLVLLNSAMGQDCTGCEFVCEAGTGGAANCDVCSPTNCLILIDTADALDAECSTCLNSDATGCDGRMLTETRLLDCEDYCDFTDGECHLKIGMNEAYCTSGCVISTTLTGCENDCNNKGCTWTGTTACECNCDCSTGEDECRAGDGCGTDYVCAGDAADICACRLECGTENGDACDQLTCQWGCAENGEQTACECAALDCTDDTSCGGVDCTASDQICDENLDEPAGCMCVPDCHEATQCNNQGCSTDEECELTDDKALCECRGIWSSTTEASGGSVLHASATVAIVAAALYSFSA